MGTEPQAVRPVVIQPELESEDQGILRLNIRSHSETDTQQRLLTCAKAHVIGVNVGAAVALSIHHIEIDGITILAARFWRRVWC